MSKKLIFIAVLFVCCLLVIWLAVAVAWPAGAVYVPDIAHPDQSVDYMARMVEAAEDGSPWALAMGSIYEQLRNEKIADMKLDYEPTDFFGAGDAQKVRDGIKAYLAPPVVEPERVYLGLYWVTGYDAFCAHCCDKSDGITASGTYATVGRTAAASSEFDFGTRLWIDGIGERIVEDRGGAIGGGRLDVVCEDHDECYSITGWRDVWLIVEG